MTELYQALMEGLRQEADHYRNLSILAEQQKEILMSGKTESLPANVRLEEKEVFNLGPLVALRNESLQKIAKGMGRKKITLSQAMEKAPLEISQSFREAVVNLVKNARGLEEVNRGNDKLLKNALSFVNFTLKAIASGGRPKKMMLNETAAQKPASSFVNRVV
jgi:hypothetical protein